MRGIGINARIVSFKINHLPSKDDMCKAVDRGMVMTDVKVLEKHGGKSGDWVAQG